VIFLEQFVEILLKNALFSFFRQEDQASPDGKNCLVPFEIKRGKEPAKMSHSA